MINLILRTTYLSTELLDSESSMFRSFNEGLQQLVVQSELGEIILKVS